MGPTQHASKPCLTRALRYSRTERPAEASIHDGDLGRQYP